MFPGRSDLLIKVSGDSKWSGEAELAEPSHGQRCRALLLLQRQPLLFLRSCEAAGMQQAEEVEAVAHLGGVGQHVVAADELRPGGRVAAVPQKNLQRTTEFKALDACWVGSF